MDKEDKEFVPPIPPLPPQPKPVTNTTLLSPTLMLAEWNVVLSCVAKGSIETHLDLFMKLKQSLEEQMKKEAEP